MSSWPGGIPRVRHYTAVIQRRILSSRQLGAFPAVFTQAVQEMLGAGGKLIRPILALCASEVGGKRFTPLAVDAAVAVEMIHVGSLVLDDIIDNSSRRRGLVCIHKRYGYDVAIIAAGILLHQASLSVSHPKHVNRMRPLVSQVALDLMLGQAMETRGDIRTMEQYLRMIELKTASLFQAAMMVGATAANLGPRATRALSAYGKRFGMAFQLRDDILDVTGVGAVVRKTLGADLRNKRPSFATIVLGRGASRSTRRQCQQRMQMGGGLKLADRLTSRFALEAIETLSDFPNTAAKRCLVALAKTVASRNS